MSFVTDVCLIDGLLDQVAQAGRTVPISHAPDSPSLRDDDEGGYQIADARLLAEQEQLSQNLPRIFELQRYIKAISTSEYPTNPIASASELLRTLRAANISSSSCDSCSQLLETGRHDEYPTYEHQLEMLLITKAINQTHGIVIKAILEHTLATQEHLWYWDGILQSHRQAWLYSLQTSPLRFWTWTKSIAHGVRSKRSTGLSEGWRKFYGSIKEVVTERSLITIQAKALSPLAAVRSEVRMKHDQLVDVRLLCAKLLGRIAGPSLSSMTDLVTELREGLESNPYLLANGFTSSSLELLIDGLEMSLRDTSLTGWHLEVESESADASQSGGTTHQISTSDHYARTPKALADGLIRILDKDLGSFTQVMAGKYSSIGRPAFLVRYWLPCAAVILSSGTLFRIVVNRRAQILEWVRESGATIRDFYLNWVVEPVRKLIGTIRHDEGSEIAIMSKRSLQGDRESLERMVVDFALSEAGAANLSQQELQTIRDSVREGDLTSVLKAYEKDLQNPIWGAIKGRLVTALLIQIQKTKVDVEVAMGGIDSLLKSQELVFGFVGLTPGIIVVFACVRWAAACFGSQRGLAAGRKRGEMMRVLLRVDRILAMPAASKEEVLYELGRDEEDMTEVEKDLIKSQPMTLSNYGMLLSECYLLRQMAQASFPKEELNSFVTDLEELSTYLTGVVKQKEVLDRIRWGYTRWI